MKKQIGQWVFAAVVLAAGSPLTAAAAMHGTATCADPSWSDLASGRCSTQNLLRPAPQSEEESSTALVADPGIPQVPEPETYAMVLVGLVAVLIASRRRRRN